MTESNISQYPSQRAGYSAVTVMTLAQVFAFIDQALRNRRKALRHFARSSLDAIFDR